jgi:predicted Fe-Mo cluster-binding NifX family protein
MRVAIPIWEGKISPVLDTASRLLILDIRDQTETSRFEIVLDEPDASRRCFRIQGLGVKTLICGAISRPFSRMLTGFGIEVIPEISGQTEDVLEAYLKGSLFHARCRAAGGRDREDVAIRST